MSLPLFPEMEPWRVPLAEAITTAAIDQVEAAASGDWLDQAYDAVYYVAEHRIEFTTDPVWTVLQDWEVPPPHEPRALGPVMRKARDRGVIEMTDRTSKSVRPECHRRPLTVYRSLVRLF